MSEKTVNKQRKSILVRLLVVVIFLYLLLSLGGLYEQLEEKRQNLVALEQKNAGMKLSIDEMNDLLLNGTEEEIIERAARDRLGYVYADEKVFVDAKGN